LPEAPEDGTQNVTARLWMDLVKECLTLTKRQQTLASGVLCVLILGSFAVAGLWPFHSPVNGVSWAANQDGVQMHEHAFILSTGALSGSVDGSCSVSMWLRTGSKEDSTALLSFYGPEGGMGLSLHRSLTDLRLDRQIRPTRTAKMYVDRILPNGRLRFLTVVSSPHGAAIYVDGILVRKSAGFVSSRGDCSGRFVVGDSPRGHGSWQGEVRGLAVYNRELPAAAVMRTYRSWRASGRPEEVVAGRPEVLYLFDERQGRRIIDHGTAGVDLVIPERYASAVPTLLQSPLSAFEVEWSYVADIIINIGGFVPFGLVLSVFLASLGRFKRVATMTVAGGLMVSLTIEVLQFYLPTRNSDLTDVLTNTLGTWLGAVVWRRWVCQWIREPVGAKSPKLPGSR